MMSDTTQPPYSHVLTRKIQECQQRLGKLSHSRDTLVQQVQSVEEALKAERSMLHALHDRRETAITAEDHMRQAATPRLTNVYAEMEAQRQKAEHAGEIYNQGRRDGEEVAKVQIVEQPVRKKRRSKRTSKATQSSDTSSSRGRHSKKKIDGRTKAARRQREKQAAAEDTPQPQIRRNAGRRGRPKQATVHNLTPAEAAARSVVSTDPRAAEREVAATT